MRSVVLAAIAVTLALVGCSAFDEDETEPTPTGDQLRREKIAFASRRDGDFEIYVVSPDGTGLARLTNDGPREADDMAPAWSPDGRMIAFVSTRTRLPDVPSVDRPADEEIYVMGADGTDQRRLTRNTNLDLAPDWLPDGRIAFVSCSAPENEPPDCVLSAIHPDGTGPKELARLGFTFEVDVSPDGRTLVYSQLEGQSHFQHFELHVKQLGGDSRQLTDDETGDGSPAWSPDGTRIAFVSNRAKSARCLFHDCAGYANEIYVMAPDGDDVTRLTETPHEESTPSWSPSGAKIVYSRIIDERAVHELYVMNADGSCATKLLPGAWDTMPDWYGPANSEGEPLGC